MRILAARYFLFQGLAGIIWWGALITSPAVLQWFTGGADPGFLRSFLAADMILFCLGSLAAAFALTRNHPAADPLCWAVTGATLYAGLLCMQGAHLGLLSTLCAVTMLPACMLTLHCSLIATQPAGFPFRVCTSASPGKALLWALVQTVGFYTVFFGVIPTWILQAQSELGIPRFPTDGFVQILAVLGFVAGGTLAITSTVRFSHWGGGTPLPTHSPRRLVTSGPYAFVRNPMAVGGIFQGVMVGLFLGSVPVMLYSLTGAIIWHLLVRPVEEEDLARRFGKEYETYRATVTCWWPAVLFRK